MEEEAKLLVSINKKDKDGFATATEQEIPIYVREKSATRSEFYEAMRSGIAVKIVLETRQEDFEMSEHIVGKKKEYASRIEYDGAVYDIIRTYRTDKGTVEITCG